ncbi:zinc finger protein 512 isoform X2 [Scleropages formosus]|uniref:zinc finger protein 512 isoform X2 n=1 Tax=Scleropages formosus TaxID=113540 RepID=UPI000877F6FB|nr:zinc finger protein 512 isoform X2 [Scleropages formosus]
MDRKSKNVSASKTSRKRKASRPRQKRKAQESFKPPEKKSKVGTDRLSKCEKTELQRPQKIKRTYERRQSQRLYAVPPEESTSESSCSSLTNGGTIVKGKRKQRRSCKPANKNVAKESKDSVPGLGCSEKKIHKEDKEPEQRAKDNEVNKESPCYIPGSQEELWNLQIVGKGRVTCPKCKTVSRKTVEGLKKHMANCKLNPFTCQHCGKQLKSLTGMKYHLMADHNDLPTSVDGSEDDSQAVKEKLRKVLKRMGKLKCSKEGCNGSFTSVMGYLYHTRKCGKEEAELEKLVLNCQHCGKAYKSRAGLEYHLKSEHTPSTEKAEDIKDRTPPKEVDPERTPSGRVKRISAQVAIFHLQEIASEELLKEWPKRKVQQDLVPDDKKLKYARPGLPAFSQEVLRKWKNEVKLQRKVQCPNQGCDSVYTSVSGLKAHLGLCSRGDFEAGKYKCLICDKEFSSESGVKYHINSIHAQDWFVVNSKASKSFEKLLKTKPKENYVKARAKHKPTLRFTLEPKAWQDRRPRVGPAPGLRAKPSVVNVERKAKEAPNSKEKDCYDFSGSDSPSSTSSSDSSSSESEPEEPETPKHDKWALKRPMARSDTARQAKSS